MCYLILFLHLFVSLGFETGIPTSPVIFLFLRQFVSCLERRAVSPLSVLPLLQPRRILPHLLITHHCGPTLSSGGRIHAVVKPCRIPVCHNLSTGRLVASQLNSQNVLSLFLEQQLDELLRVCVFFLDRSSSSACMFWIAAFFVAVS